MADTSVTTSAPRWMKIALPISLAINVGIVGVVGGAFLRAPSVAHDRIETPEGVAMLARAMPSTHQRELRAALRDQREGLQPDRQTLRTLRNRFVTSLRNEPFDIGEVNLVFIDQRAMLTNLTAAGHDAVIEQIKHMTPEDREQYVQKLLNTERPNGHE